jgi:hypothetical protein
MKLLSAGKYVDRRGRLYIVEVTAEQTPDVICEGPGEVVVQRGGGEWQADVGQGEVAVRWSSGEMVLLRRAPEWLIAAQTSAVEPLSDIF